MGSGYITGKVSVAPYKYTGVDTPTAETNVDNENKTISVNVNVGEVTKDCQETLVSGENIKTINGESILGAGNIDVTVFLDDYYTKEETQDILSHYYTSSYIDEHFYDKSYLDPILNNAVTLTGSQTISGEKTFNGGLNTSWAYVTGNITGTGNISGFNWVMVQGIDAYTSIKTPTINLNNKGFIGLDNNSEPYIDFYGKGYVKGVDSIDSNKMSVHDSYIWTHYDEYDEGTQSWVESANVYYFPDFTYDAVTSPYARIHNGQDEVVKAASNTLVVKSDLDVHKSSSIFRTLEGLLEDVLTNPKSDCRTFDCYYGAASRYGTLKVAFESGSGWQTSTYYDFIDYNNVYRFHSSNIVRIQITGSDNYYYRNESLDYDLSEEHYCAFTCRGVGTVYTIGDYYISGHLVYNDSGEVILDTLVTDWTDVASTFEYYTLQDVINGAYGEKVMTYASQDFVTNAVGVETARAIARENDIEEKTPQFFNGFVSGKNVGAQVPVGEIKYCTYGTDGGVVPKVLLRWTQGAKKAIYLNTIYIKYIDKQLVEQEYSYTFTSKTFSAVNQSLDLGGLTWLLTDPNNDCYFGYSSSYGQQIGSGTQAASDLQISTEDLAGCFIKEVKVTCCGAASTLAQLSITVGEDQWLYHEGEADESTSVVIPDRDVSASVNFTYGEGTQLDDAEPTVYSEVFLRKVNDEIVTSQAIQRIIYANLDDEKIYRYNGVTLIEISKVMTLGNTSTTAYRGDYGQQNYDRLQNIFTGTSTFAGNKTFTGWLDMTGGTSLETNIAPEYNSEYSYTIGDHVFYGGYLYRCTEDIAAPAGDMDWSKWTRTSVLEYVNNRVAGASASLNSAIEAENSRALAAEGSLSNTTVKLTGDQTVGGIKTFTSGIALAGSGITGVSDLTVTGNITDGTDSVTVATIATKQYVADLDKSVVIQTGAMNSIEYSKLSGYKLVFLYGYKDGIEAPNQFAFFFMPDQLTLDGEDLMFSTQAGSTAWQYQIKVKRDSDGNVYWWTVHDYGGSYSFVVTKIVGVK